MSSAYGAVAFHPDGGDIFYACYISCKLVVEGRAKQSSSNSPPPPSLNLWSTACVEVVVLGKELTGVMSLSHGFSREACSYF